MQFLAGDLGALERFLMVSMETFMASAWKFAIPHLLHYTGLF